MFWKALAGLFLLKYGISFARFLCTMVRLYVLPKFGMKLNLKKFGSWAVITGATDGIGKAITFELAKRGLNVVLVSRSEEKLKAVAKEIEENTKVQTKIIVHDFTSLKYDHVEKQLEGLEVGILVNNVGRSYDHPDYYLSFDEKTFDDMVNINVASVLKMTRLVLKSMAERKRGLVVHISSTSAKMPTPFLTVYSASKAFVEYFGNGLQYEYASSGVKSQVVAAHFVATKLSKLRPNGTTIPTPAAYAKSMVDALGITPSMAGYWSHEIIQACIRLVPTSVLMSQTYNAMNSTRKRWLRKQEKKSE